VRVVEKIDEGVWIKFLAPVELRQKLIQYAKSQGKSYAQVLREFIEKLPADH
jgi:predicted DNA-binding protein